jgi:hypothetical protein
MGFRVPPAYDNQVLVNDAWAGQRNRQQAVIAAQIFAQINSSALSKCRNRLAGLSVKRIQKIGDRGEDAAIFAIRPIGKPSHWILAGDAGVELPNEPAGCGVESNDFLRRGVGIENVPQDDGLVSNPPSSPASNFHATCKLRTFCRLI